MVLWCWNVDNSDRIINIPMPLNNLLRILFVINSLWSSPASVWL